MSSISSTFPILVMTRNDNQFIKKCVESIINTVTIPITIYIVDNNSDSDEHHLILKELAERFENVNVVLNKNNYWILGLNETILKVKKNHIGKYFFLTDADIDFSNCKAKPCWLSYMIECLEKNVSIGKLGISLDWSYLSKHEKLYPILLQEKSLYSDSKMINDLYVSSVDTTATLFRFDWSIEQSSFFYPDHMRYLRPELYSCRTNREVLVEHLGWYTYNEASSLNKSHINSKVLCFTLVGGDVKEAILEMSDFKYEFFYRTSARLIRKLWVLRRCFYQLKYYICKGVKNFDGQGV